MNIHEQLEALLHSNEALWSRLIAPDLSGGGSGGSGAADGLPASRGINGDAEIVENIADLRAKWKLATGAAKNMFESNVQCVAHIMQLQKEKSILENAHAEEVNTLNNRVQALLSIVDSQQQEVEVCASTLSLRNLWKRLITSALSLPATRHTDQPPSTDIKRLENRSPTAQSSNGRHRNNNISGGGTVDSNSIGNNSSKANSTSTYNSNGARSSTDNEAINLTDLLENSATIVTLLSLQCSKELENFNTIGSAASASGLASEVGDSLMSALLAKLSVMDRLISDEFNAIKHENLDLRNKIHSKSLGMEQLQYQYSDYNELQRKCKSSSDELGNLKMQYKRLSLESNNTIQQLKLKLEHAEANLATSNARNAVLESQYKDSLAASEHWQRMCRQYHDIMYTNAMGNTQRLEKGEEIAHTNDDNSDNNSNNNSESNNDNDNDNSNDNNDYNSYDSENAIIVSAKQNKPSKRIDNSFGEGSPALPLTPARNCTSADKSSIGDSPMGGRDSLARTISMYDSSINQTVKPAALPGMSLFDDKSIYDHALISNVSSPSPPPTSPLFTISDLYVRSGGDAPLNHLESVNSDSRGPHNSAMIPESGARSPIVQVKPTRASLMRAASNKGSRSQQNKKEFGDDLERQQDELRLSFDGGKSSPDSSRFPEETGSSLIKGGSLNSSRSYSGSCNNSILSEDSHGPTESEHVDGLDDLGSMNGDVQKALDFINSVIP